METSVLTKLHPACNENIDADHETRARQTPRLNPTRTHGERALARQTREPAPAGAAHLVDTLRAMVRDIVREELARARPAAAPESNAYLSTRAAASHAGVATGTIRRWIRDGKLRELRAGRHLRVRRADLDALLAGDRAGPDEVSPEELAQRAFGS